MTLRWLSMILACGALAFGAMACGDDDGDGAGGSDGDGAGGSGGEGATGGSGGTGGGSGGGDVGSGGGDPNDQELGLEEAIALLCEGDTDPICATCDPTQTDCDAACVQLEDCSDCARAQCCADCGPGSACRAYAGCMDGCEQLEDDLEVLECFQGCEADEAGSAGVFQFLGCLSASCTVCGAGGF